MKPFRRITGLAVVVLMTVMAPFPSGSRAASQKEGPVVVGRVSHIEGELLSYVYEEKDWVPILKDVPFGLEDTLYSDQDARAEIIFPNGTWIRIGGNTQIQAITLDDDVTEIDVASGIARFYNRGSQGVIQATTPFGYVLAPAGTMFDLYVGDESAEVIALKGTVDFVHARSESRYEVQSGSSSLVVDDQAVAAGQGLVDAGFDDWNGQRDSLWAKRLEVKGDSTRYLPSQLHDDAYELEENGRWERVQYEGEYRQLWRPTRVGPEWA
ncbi:MAG: FecR domain-containing protein, partial [Syntrophobacteraceae bacterium]|nr:FecR domain-containing protein [Syntrophobacteraceae bacterium]